MLSPAVVLLVAGSLYPLIWIFRYMFYTFDGMRPPRFVGMENFIRIFTRDPWFWSSVRNTFVYAGGKLLVTIPLAFLLAVILNKKMLGRGFFRAFFFMPTIVSVSVMSLIFYFIFNTYNGILNQLLIRFSIIPSPIEWLGVQYAMFSAIVIAIWGAIGNYMVYFLAGLQSIPRELYESAELDGASESQTLMRITIPMMGPVLQVVIMLAILVSLRGYESILVLTGGGPSARTEVVYLYIFRQFFPMAEAGAFISQFGYGSAVAFVTSVIIGLITIFYLWWSRRMNEVY
ncbi:MAG: sugar ABC transporter permease [Spirochaetaceae bacterium]|nr:MAG: sugar ABC transporter permease [Spirochaetaceae bacterium]